MLVLTRKAAEKIQIGSQVTVTVIEVRGRYVRLGIEAPNNVRIIRKELLPASPAEAASQEAAAPIPQPADPGSTTPAC
jgi:carbon storage regulator CsrA